MVQRKRQGFTGATTIQQGTLRASNNYAAESLSSVNIYPGATLDMFAGNFSINTLSGSGAVTNSYTNAVTLTVGGSGGTSEFDGAISNGTGKIAVTKAGSGAFILTGANTYTGATTVNAGVLQVANTAALGTGPLTINPGGTLNLAFVRRRRCP